METRNEKWQSLRMEAQKFSPHEYVAGCPITIIGQDIIVNEDTDIFASNEKFVLDIGEDRLWTSVDKNQSPDTFYNTDGNPPSPGTKLTYFGKAWLAGSTKPSHINAGTNMDVYEYVNTYQKPGSSNMHVYAADLVDIMGKNLS